jgi:hypothetical protein
MKLKFLKNKNDEWIAIPFDEDLTEYCPVCGSSMEYGYVYDDHHSPSHDICSNCKTQFGYDDAPGRASGVSTDEFDQRVRKDWLEELGWLDWQVDQLRDVLNITVDRENKTVPLVRVADLMKAQQSDSSRTE